MTLHVPFKGLSAALLLTIVACSPAAPTPSNTTTTGSNAPAGPKPAAVQTAIIGANGVSSNLDPHAFISLNGRQYDLFETLVAMDDNAQPGDQGLAKSWKSIDPLTWQFTLWPDSKFHDGGAVTADDIKFSFERVLNTKPPLSAIQRIATIDRVDVIDKVTVNLVTKAPDPILIRRTTGHPIISKAAFERLGVDKFSLAPIASGPFKVKEYTPSTKLVLSAFTEHPRRKPRLSEITFIALPEVSARIAGLKTGDVDFAFAVGLSQFDALNQAGLKQYTLQTGQSGSVRLSAIAESPLKDKRVRQAINYAVDKDLMAKQIYKGVAKVEQGQILQPEVFGFNPNLKPYPFEPATAKKLLAEAGYPNGFKITYEQNSSASAEFKDMGLMIQSQLKDVGIDVDFINIADSATYNAKFNGTVERAPMFGTTASFAPAMDGDFGMLYFWGGRPPALRYIANPEYDRLYEASTKETDVAKRLVLLNQALAVMRDDPPVLFTIQNITQNAYGPKLQGVVNRFDRDPWYDKLWKSE